MTYIHTHLDHLRRPDIPSPYVYVLKHEAYLGAFRLLSEAFDWMRFGGTMRLLVAGQIEKRGRWDDEDGQTKIVRVQL